MEGNEINLDAFDYFIKSAAMDDVRDLEEMIRARIGELTASRSSFIKPRISRLSMVAPLDLTPSTAVVPRSKAVRSRVSATVVPRSRVSAPEEFAESKGEDRTAEVRQDCTAYIVAAALYPSNMNVDVFLDTRQRIRVVWFKDLKLLDKQQQGRVESLSTSAINKIKTPIREAAKAEKGVKFYVKYVIPQKFGGISHGYNFIAMTPPRSASYDAVWKKIIGQQNNLVWGRIEMKYDSNDIVPDEIIVSAYVYQDFAQAPISQIEKTL